MNVQIAPKLNNEPVEIVLFEHLLYMYTYDSMVLFLEKKLLGTGMNMAEIRDLATNIHRLNFKIVDGRMYIHGKLVETPTTHVYWVLI